MVRKHIDKKNRIARGYGLRSGYAGLMGSLATVLLLALPLILSAQSSPLTVQPSTGRVGVGNSNPGYTLDVTGTVNATNFRGDGSQLTNLPGGGGNALLNKVTANTTISGTTAESTLYSFSVAGGTFGTNNVLRLTAQVADLDISDSNSCTLRFKYGGTTIGSMTFSAVDFSLVNGKALISFIIAADGATNAQLGTVVFHASSRFGPTLAQGTASVDSTGAQTLVITTQSSNSTSITLGQAMLEKLL